MYLASAGGADKQIRIWHNRPGLSETVRDLRDRLLKSSSDALKVCWEGERGVGEREGGRLGGKYFQ